MKLHASTHSIEKSGTFEESKFSIEASSKAFFILSDGLYSNKILAVVRELSTNAYDSHVEAGKKDVAFDVHLPTPLKPVFFIRDYGTSMDHDSCMQLYTTYFRSTRNHSNDAVGCLGLGSKAPFAYSDSFTVEAYLNGTCRIYSAYKNEDGSPVFSLMEEIPTSEPDGIKVSININDYDTNRFRHEAAKIYEYFKVKPNFIGEKINFANPNKVLAGDNWYFDDDRNDNLIIMGQIAYPLDANQLTSGENDSSKFRNFINYSDGLRIFVNIGDVDITPSRESLSYSRETKTNITTIINKIMTDITVKIEEQIKNQSSLYKARVKYVQISDQCSSIKSAVESLQKSITWNNIKLFDSITGENIDVKDKISCKRLSKNTYRKKVDTELCVEKIFFNNNVKFIVDNLNRGGLSRIKKYMQTSDSSMTCYVYKLEDGETVDNCRLYDIIGGATKDDVILTSLLPKIQYNRSSSGGDYGPAVQIQVYNEETGKFEECNMSVQYENAHYFVESKGNIKIGYSDIDISNFEIALSYIHDKYNDDVSGMTFYLVKPSVVKNRKLESRDNWINGERILEKVFGDAVVKHKQDIIDTNCRYSLSKEYNDRWMDVISLTKDNELKKIVNEYKEFTKRFDSIRTEMWTIKYMCDKLTNVESVNINTVTVNVDKFSKRFDAEMKKYPMLKICNFPYNDKDKKIVSEYIDNVENNLAKVSV
ncbi:hypothetical protein EB001_01915 [bacterium]|nr:hypothetical protein [bacterium]